MSRLTLLAVHAHPDDESMSTGGTFARYGADPDVRTVLVTCTGGEVGEILDPTLDLEAARPRLGDIRRRELECAVNALGIDKLILLGYRDSGMAGTADNDDPRSFHQADFEEATRRLIAIVRRERPEVLVSYNENGGYGHPDHIMAHRITVAAFDRAGDPNDHPELGPAWQPSKLYQTAWPRGVMLRTAELLVSRGEPNPFADRDPNTLGTPDDQITTTISILDYLDHKRAAWRCHRTQITEQFLLLRLPDEIVRSEMANEYFVRVRGRIAAPDREDDLFAGLRAGALQASR